MKYALQLAEVSSTERQTARTHIGIDPLHQDATDFTWFKIDDAYPPISTLLADDLLVRLARCYEESAAELPQTLGFTQMAGLDSTPTDGDSPTAWHSESFNLLQARNGAALQPPNDPLAPKDEISCEVILDAIPVPIFYKSRQGVHLGCNRAFEHFSGRTRSEIIGRTVFDLAPHHLAETYSAMDEALFRSGGIQQYEVKSSSSDGVVRNLILRKTALTNQSGDPIGMIGVMLDITDRKQAEQSLEKALEFAEGVIAAIPDVLFEVDADGCYLQVWTKNEELLAQQKKVLIGKMIHDVLSVDQAAIAMVALREANENGVSYGRCLNIPLPNGETRYFELSVAKRSTNDSLPNTFLVLSRDITERKQAESAIDAARTHLLSMLQTIPDFVWAKDLTGKYLLCNHAFERLLGRAEADIVGKTDHELFADGVARYFCDGDREVMDAGRVIIREEWVTSHQTGRPILLESRKVPMFGADGKATGILGMARDITELSASREKIHEMAFYDPLTSLPNRALFSDRFRQMIADASQRRERAGVMLIDLDRFKTVNDTMGHPAGDELLCQAAKRLKASVRDCDTVARLGGDEFAILMPDIQHKDELDQIANRILDKFAERFLLGDKEVFISCSIGIAFYPDDSTNIDDLVRYSDAAMYCAKRLGRSNFRFYSKELTTDAEQRLTLETELRRAIEREELELHYQPKILLKDGSLIGSEALLRWHHREMGMIPPSQFIEVAEEIGLITDLGQWVLWEACRTAAILNAQGLPRHKVAINLSARQFQGGNFAKLLAEALEQTGCRAEWIEVEITESLLLHKSEGVSEALSELHSNGVSIAIDDFGTGYSALSYLAQFPIDTLKIDRSFINSEDGRSKELVKAILSIARCLGQRVVAEGVETAEQASFLAENGCEAAQGFLYSKALPKTEIITLQHQFRNKIR